MKKIIFLALATFFCYTGLAQQLKLQPFEPNPILDKYVGTWVTQTGGKTITIIIKKIQVPFMTTKADMLEGYLVHKDNGAVIEQSDTPLLTLGNDVAPYGKVRQDTAFFSYYDKRREKTGRLEVAISKDNPNEIKTFLREDGNHHPLTAKNKDGGFTLPWKLVFKKQN